MKLIEEKLHLNLENSKRRYTLSFWNIFKYLTKIFKMRVLQIFTQPENVPTGKLVSKSEFAAVVVLPW